MERRIPLGQSKEYRLFVLLGLSLMAVFAYLEVEIEGSHHVHPLRKALQGRRGESISLQAISSPFHTAKISAKVSNPDSPSLSHRIPRDFLYQPLPVTFFSFR